MRSLRAIAMRADKGFSRPFVSKHQPAVDRAKRHARDQSRLSVEPEQQDDQAQGDERGAECEDQRGHDPEAKVPDFVEPGKHDRGVLADVGEIRLSDRAPVKAHHDVVHEAIDEPARRPHQSEADKHRRKRRDARTRAEAWSAWSPSQPDSESIVPLTIGTVMPVEDSAAIASSGTTAPTVNSSASAPRKVRPMVPRAGPGGAALPPPGSAGHSR